MNRPPFKRGQKPPTAAEMNELAARRGLASFRILPIKVTLSGSANPYGWTENDGPRSGTADAYELNDKTDLDGRETMLYAAPAGWNYFRCKGVVAADGMIRVRVRNACNRNAISGASVVVRNSSNVIVATGTTGGTGLYTTIALPVSGNPYSVRVTSGSNPAVTTSVTVVAGDTVETIVDIVVGAASQVTMRIEGYCFDIPTGASITVTGPAGYSSSGTIDAFGYFYPAPIPRTWEYRGEGATGGGVYEYTITHPEYLGTTGTFPMTCSQGDAFLEPALFLKPCRHYSGDRSFGTDCFDKPYPATLATTLDLSSFAAIDPAYSAYSGSYTLNFYECGSGLNQATYIGCFDMGDRYMNVAAFINPGGIQCEGTYVTVSLGWYQKPAFPEGTGPCANGNNLASPEPIGIFMFGSDDNACINTLNASGPEGSIGN